MTLPDLPLPMARASQDSAKKRRLGAKAMRTNETLEGELADAASDGERRRAKL